MNEYRGQVRRIAENTPTKSSWESRKNDFEQGQHVKYSRIKEFEKSELSYYQSEVSHTIYQNESVSQKQTDKVRTFNENSELYDHLIPVKLQHSDSEEGQKLLRVQIVNTIERKQNKLTLYLTDDRNPKFLWLFFIVEDDFKNLKKEHSLRVDFRGFPNMLIDHFEMCKSQKQAANSINLNESYFFSRFQIKKSNEGCLSILESNVYKESEHLSLKCKLANDQQVKEYLSQKLLKCEGSNQQLRQTVSNLEHSLSIRKQEISRVQIELNQQKKINENSQIQSKLQLDKLETLLKSQKVQSEESIKKELEKEYKEMKHSLEGQLAKVSKSYDQLKVKCELTEDKLKSIESKDRQSSFDLLTKTKEIETYTRRIQEQKAYINELQGKANADQKMIIEQKVRIQSLERQITDKVKIIESNIQLKSTNSHQIISLERKGEEYRKQVEKLEAKIDTLEAQLEKTEGLVNDYREKYQQKKAKITFKNQIIKQQEKFVNEKQNEVFDLQRRLQQKEKLIDEATFNVEEKDRKIFELKRQIGECQSKLKDNSDMIVHMQKQLNEKAIGSRTGLNYHRPTSPFSSAVNGRDYLNNTSSNSRLKFTSTGNEQSSDNLKKVPEIKRYEDSGFRERSKSPVINSRFNQQKQLQEETNSNHVKPVKFKFSQKND